MSWVHGLGVATCSLPVLSQGCAARLSPPRLLGWHPAASRDGPGAGLRAFWQITALLKSAFPKQDLWRWLGPAAWLWPENKTLQPNLRGERHGVHPVPPPAPLNVGLMGSGSPRDGVHGMQTVPACSSWAWRGRAGQPARGRAEAAHVLARHVWCRCTCEPSGQALVLPLHSSGAVQPLPHAAGAGHCGSGSTGPRQGLCPILPGRNLPR